MKRTLVAALLLCLSSTYLFGQRNIELKQLEYQYEMLTEQATNAVLLDTLTNWEKQARGEVEDAAVLSFIYEKLAKSYFNTGNYKQANEYGLKGLEYGYEVKDSTELIEQIMTVTQSFTLLGKSRDALAHAKVALNNCEKVKCVHSPKLYVLFSDIYSSMGNGRQDSIFLAKGLEVATASRDTLSIIRILNNIGRHLSRSGSSFEALIYFEKAREIGVRFRGECEGLGTLLNIGIIYQNQNDYEQSLEKFLLVEKCAILKGRKDMLSYALLNITHGKLNNNDTLNLDKVSLQQLEIARELQNELILAQALAYRASALEKLNRLSEALVVGEESISVAEHQEDIIAKVRSYLSVGRILLKANKLELAESYCRIVEDLIKKNTKSTLGIKSNTYDLLHQIMAKKGAYEEAYYYRGHYQSTMDSIRNETSIRKINTLTLQHEHEQALSEEQAKTQAAQYRLEQQRIQYSLLAVLLILAVVSLLLVYNLYNKKRKYSEELEMINSIIQQKGKQINDKNKKLDRFTYSISHDIISRLNNLVLLGTILANDEQPDSLQKFRGQAVERLTALMTYCRELLQWAKSETNGKALPTDLSEIMAAAIKEYSPRIQQYQTKVSTDFLPIVQLPRVVAENVFMNLVDNAVKYSKDAQPYPRVQITAKERPEQQQWVITIQDNGRGMTAAQQRQMFEITRDSKGLALVKKNLENHNGQIWLEQSSATGTSICVAVPAVQEEAE